VCKKPLFEYDFLQQDMAVGADAIVTHQECISDSHQGRGNSDGDDGNVNSSSDTRNSGGGTNGCSGTNRCGDGAGSSVTGGGSGNSMGGSSADSSPHEENDANGAGDAIAASVAASMTCGTEGHGDSSRALDSDGGGMIGHCHQEGDQVEGHHDLAEDGNECKGDCGVLGSCEQANCSPRSDSMSATTISHALSNAARAQALLSPLDAEDSLEGEVDKTGFAMHGWEAPTAQEIDLLRVQATHGQFRDDASN